VHGGAFVTAIAFEEAVAPLQPVRKPFPETHARHPPDRPCRHRAQAARVCCPRQSQLQHKIKPVAWRDAMLNLRPG
jgi:hypothetical protein